MTEKKAKKKEPQLPPAVKATRDARRVAKGTLNDPKASYGEKVGAMLSLTMSYLKAVLVPAVLISIATEIPMAVLSFNPKLVFSEAPPEQLDQYLFITAGLYSAVFTLIGAATVVALALQHRNAEPLDVGRALGRGASNWLGVLASDLFGELICAAWAVLLIVPGVMRFLDYTIRWPLVISGEAYGVDSLEKSRKRMFGFRTVALGALLVAAIPSFVTDAIMLWEGFSKEPINSPMLDAAVSLFAQTMYLPVVMVAVAFYDVLTEET